MSIKAILAKEALVGPELEVLKDACILVEDGKISEIMTKADYTAFKNGAGAAASIEETDLGDRTVMPGLIECHAHLALDARVPNHLDLFAGSSECEHTISALKGLKDELMAGITTSRSLGDRNYIDVVIRDQIKAGKVTGPDLLVCGVGMKGRHGHGYVGQSHSGVEEFRRTARENMYRGVDCLKIFVTPGAPSKTADDFIPCFITPEEIRTVVTEGKQLNIPTVAHCIGGMGLNYCVQEGVYCIEHLYSIKPEQVKLLEEQHEGWVDLTSGIVLDPGREEFLSPGHIRNMQGGRAYTRECLIPVYNSDKIRWTIGTDAYHGNLYKEVEIAVDCGAEPLRAVKAVTVNAAKMLRIDGKKGQLAKGLNADIIAVPSNPLNNVSVLGDVSFVMKSGTVYKA